MKLTFNRKTNSLHPETRGSGLERACLISVQPALLKRPRQDLLPAPRPQFSTVPSAEYERSWTQTGALEHISGV